jgi:hypothetical protein
MLTDAAPSVRKPFARSLKAAPPGAGNTETGPRPSTCSRQDLDETRLAVVDDTGVIAEHVWRPSDNYQPGPATWDWALYRLGYDRRSCASLVTSENPSDDHNEADDGQDGPNDAHVRSLLLLLVFLGGLLEMRYQYSDGSDGTEGQYR